MSNRKNNGVLLGRKVVFRGKDLKNIKCFSPNKHYEIVGSRFGAPVVVDNKGDERMISSPEFNLASAHLDNRYKFRFVGEK